MNVFEAARQADCVRAAERLGLRLKRSGGRAYACCLFHAERTPSMCLYPGDGGFYCFGCHAHGDAIALYGKALNLTPLEAARQVCQDFGFQYDTGRCRKRAPPLPQPAHRADAWTLAKQLDALRERQADTLLAQMRGAEAVMHRVEAAHDDPEAVLDDADWQRAMRAKSTAQEQLAMLDGMTLAEFLEYYKQGARPLTGRVAACTPAVPPRSCDAPEGGGAADKNGGTQCGKKNCGNWRRC